MRSHCVSSDSFITHTHTRAHTHTRLTALCPGLPVWASTRKVKPIWILLKQETMSGTGISWAICKSASRSRQITMWAPPPLSFYRPDALALPATQPTVSKHWRQVRQLHTHTPFNGPFSRTTRVGQYQKGKTNLDFTGARDSEWQWHQLGCMQVCTLLQTDNHTSTSPLSFLQAGCPSCRPTNSVKALKAQDSCIMWWNTKIIRFCKLVGNMTLGFPDRGMVGSCDPL